jgi:hypothetical protein
VISSDHLDPGAIGRVKVTVTTANISGPVSKHISIYSNDRVTPVLSVEVALNVALNNVVTKETASTDTAPKGVAPK